LAARGKSFRRGKHTLSCQGKGKMKAGEGAGKVAGVSGKGFCSSYAWAAVSETKSVWITSETIAEYCRDVTLQTVSWRSGGKL
jgi:hypothetical protein